MGEKNLKSKRTEHGRTMLEMLAVLAIVGVLSIVIMVSLRYAFIRAKANAIIHDSRLVFVESTTRLKEVEPNTWELATYGKESQKELHMMKDKQGSHYVKVLGVERPVCKQLLHLQKEGELVFLTEENYASFTECDQDNNMVVAFDGLGVPHECQTRLDCGEDFPGKCSEAGQCEPCDETLEVWNDNQGICDCNEGSAQTCSIEEEETFWCCPLRKYICGETAGSCINNPHECDTPEDCVDLGKTNHFCDSEHQCTACDDPLSTVDLDANTCVCDSSLSITCKQGEKVWCCGKGKVCDMENEDCTDSTGWCEYTLDISDFSIDRSTDCAYKLDISDFSIDRGTNCAYNLDISDFSIVRTTNCAYSLDISDFSIARSTNCAYNLNISNFSINRSTNCAANVVSVNTANGTVLSMTPIIDSERGLRACTGNTYCAMTYSDYGCSNYAGAGATTVYGSCVPTNNFTPTCTTETVGSISFTPVIDNERGLRACTGDTYCAMTYSDYGCSNYAGAGATTIYGSCIPTNNFTPTCSTETSGAISFTPIIDSERGLRACTGDTYCAMTYSDQGCSNYAGAGASTIYGSCIPTNNFTPTCSTEARGDIRFTPIIDSERGLRACEENTYCAMTYSDYGCSNYAGAGASTIYGSCLPTNNFTPTCVSEPKGSISFTPIIDSERGLSTCTGDTYCAMTYSDYGCSNYAGAGATTIYGSCIPMNNFTPTCKTEPEGEIRFTPIPGKECPVDTFCAMTWRNKSCQGAGAGETHLYGHCQELNQLTPTCPQ